MYSSASYIATAVSTPAIGSRQMHRAIHLSAALALPTRPTGVESHH